MTKIICSWCDNVIQDGAEPSTHSICGDCSEGLDDEIHIDKLRAEHRQANASELLSLATQLGQRHASY